MCKMTGYSKEELMQLNVEGIIDPEQLKIEPVVHGYRGSGQILMRERRLVRKDGTKFDVEINVKMFPDEKVLVIARDITDRKRMEAERRDAELKFRTLAEKSMVGVYISKQQRFTYVNPRFAEIFGYDPEELINTKENAIKIIIHDDDQEEVWKAIQARYNGEADNAHYEIRGKRKDGTVNYVEFYGNRVIIDGEAAIIGTMLDITERKRADDLILREKALSETIINSLPEVFYLRNEKGMFLRWNKNFEKVTGYSPDEIQALNSKDLVAEEDHGKIREAIEKMFDDGSATFEAKVIPKDGTRVPFLITVSPLVYEDQQCVLGIAIDISSRLKAEEELRSSENKYKLLFESTPQPLTMIAKDDLSFIAVNDAAVNLYGYTKEEFLNLKATVLRPKEDLEQLFEIFRREILGSTDLGVIRHVKKDGTVISVHIIAHDIIFEDRLVRLSLSTDITEKLKAEELLQKSEANLKTIMDTTDTAYALLDKKLSVIAFNQMAVKFVNSHYNHTVVKGDKLVDYFPKDRLPQFASFANEVLKGRNINYEVNYPQSDGSVAWYHVRLFPITNDNKDILGMMMALNNITERKNAEENLKVAYQLVQDHINSIKEMAWKQSHLIRSPVANLKGLAALLKEDPADGELLKFINIELDRLDTVIIDMAEDASTHD
jgi:two-component system, sporulation sensor kinase E